MQVDPAVVRFTHSRISPFFSGCGMALEDTLADIVTGKFEIFAVGSCELIFQVFFFFNDLFSEQLNC